MERRRKSRKSGGDTAACKERRPAIFVTPLRQSDGMWQGLIITVVVILWKMLSFIDAYLDGRLATRVGRAVVVGIAAISWLVPGAFAAGTKQFVDAESKVFTSWLTRSLRDVLDWPISVLTPTTPSTTTTTTTTTTTSDPSTVGN